jgi:hypothetical protein
MSVKKDAFWGVPLLKVVEAYPGNQMSLLKVDIRIEGSPIRAWREYDCLVAGFVFLSTQGVRMLLVPWKHSDLQRRATRGHSAEPDAAAAQCFVLNRSNHGHRVFGGQAASGEGRVAHVGTNRVESSDCEDALT